MVLDLKELGAVILIGLTSVYILIGRDWRYSIAALAVQYIGVFLLVDVSWPIEKAVTKMVAGWMAGAILGIAITSSAETWRDSEQSVKFGPLFRLIVVAILALTVTSLVVHSEGFLSFISPTVLWGSFFLVSIGLLQLSFTSHPLKVIIGLLTCLSGFEIIYAAIESSVLVTGLLAVTNIGLALVGAYLLIAPTMEPSG